MSACLPAFHCGAIDVLRIKETLGAAFSPAHLLPELPADAIEANSRFCADAALARATRKRILADCADSGALFAPAHWGPPHAARIVSIAASFSLMW